MVTNVGSWTRVPSTRAAGALRSKGSIASNGCGVTLSPPSANSGGAPQIARFRLRADKDPRWLVMYSRNFHSRSGLISPAHWRNKSCRGESRTMISQLPCAAHKTFFICLRSLERGSCDREAQNLCGPPELTS